MLERKFVIFVISSQLLSIQEYLLKKFRREKKNQMTSMKLTKAKKDYKDQKIAFELK